MEDTTKKDKDLENQNEEKSPCGELEQQEQEENFDLREFLNNDKELDKESKKNPFEGQYEITCEYKLKYKDLFEGFDVIGKPLNIFEKALRVGATLGGVILFCKGQTIAGAIIFLIAFYFLMRDIVAPYSYRSKISKIISKRKETYTASFYPHGVRITEKDKVTNIMYSDVTWKEYKNVHVILYKSRIAVIPKRYIKDKFDDIMALAKHQFIEYIVM